MAWSKDNGSQSAVNAAQYVDGKKPLIEQAIVDANVAKPLAENAKIESGQAKVTSGQADTKATDALAKATSAKSTAETVQGEFDRVVAEAGSNNPEVVQARGGEVTLKARLDKTTAQLADTGKKIKNIVSVKEFENLKVAVANGWDWSPAIQWAINSLSAGKVMIDDIYSCHQTLKLKNGITLEGVPGLGELLLFNVNIVNDTGTVKDMGLNKLKITRDLSSTFQNSLIEFTGTSANPLTNILITDCFIDSSSIGVSCIALNYTNQSEVSQNVIKNSGTGCGIVTLTCKGIRIRNNKLSYLGRVGIQVFNFCDDVIIEGNTVSYFMLRRAVEDGGIDSYGDNNTNVKILNNTVDTGNLPAFTTGKHGCIRVLGGRNFVIANNTLTARGSTVGKVVCFGERSGYMSDDIIFKDNNITVLNNAEYVFRMVGVNNADINGNTVELTTGITLAAFSEVRTSMKNLRFTKNRINMNSVPGNIMTLYNGIVTDSIYMDDNDIKNAKNFMIGANLSTVNNLFVRGNFFNTTGNAAFFVYPTMLKLILANNILNSVGTSVTNQTNGTTVSIIESNLMTA